MNKYLPDFIINRFKEHKYKGFFKGTILMIDIVGFTEITERLITHGKEGSEILSDIINQIFEPTINEIYKKDGWISSFAGDAFTAIFETPASLSAISASERIQKLFRKFNVKTKFGKFNLTVRIGLSCGKIDWGIIKNENQNTYFFRGAGIDTCALTMHHSKSGEIILHKNLFQLISKKVTAKRMKAGFYIYQEHITQEEPNRIKVKKLIKKIASSFFPESIVKFKGLGEFRNIIPVFISFKERSGELHNFLKIVIDKTYQYNGYFNKVDFGDKGGVIVVLFGAPRGIENIHRHAVEFILDLKDSVSSLADIKAGLTEGLVFVGIIGSKFRSEYTALGKVVNLSARLMETTKKNGIYIDEKLAREITGRYKIEKKRAKKVKGFKGLISIYKLSGKVSSFDFFYSGEMFGRKEKLKRLLKFISPIYKFKFGGIVYIDGPAGIGKSRLVHELQQRIDLNKTSWFYFQTNEILKESFNPIIYFLKNYFNQLEENLEEENKKNFEKKLKGLLKKVNDPAIKNELIRTKVFLGALINLFWPGSLYDQVGSQMKLENTFFALKTLIKAESLVNPVIIEIEDGHWLDPMTIRFLKTLTMNVKKFPFIIISACRFNDDGTSFRIPLEEVPMNSIKLEKLDKELTKEIIIEKLGNEVTTKLSNLVFKKSEGNPFYVEQILMYLKESNFLTFFNEKYDIKKEKFEIPGKISTIIISRLDKLSHDLKDLVKTASVLGREFSISVLSGMLRWQVIKKEVKRIEDENIWSAISEINYIFKHALIRETIYEMQLKKRLRKLHKLAGDIIERFYKDDLVPHYGELAYHFDNAEVKRKAKSYLLLAGSLAKEAYKNEEVLQLFDTAEKYLTNREKVFYNHQKAEIYYHIGDWKKTETILKGNLLRAKRLKYKRLELKIKNFLGALYNTKGDYVKSSKILLKLYKDTSKLKSKELFSSVLNNLGNLYVNKGEIIKAIDYYKKAIRISKRLKSIKNIPGFYSNLGDSYRFIGKPKKAEKYFEKGLKIAEKTNDKFVKDIILGNLAILYFQRGDLELSSETFQKQLQVAIELGDKFGEALAYGNIATIHWGEGEFEKSQDLLLRKMEIVKELGNKRSLNIIYGNLGSLYLSSGDLTNAEKCFMKKLKDAEKMKDEYNIAISFGYLGWLSKRKKQYNKEMKYFTKAISLCRKLKEKDFLCEYLCEKANLLFSMKKYKESKKLNMQASKIANELKFHEKITFTKILELKLFGLKDIQKSESGMLKLLSKKVDINAQIYFELWKLTKKENYKKEAKKLLKQISNKTKKLEYKELLKEL
ncbi:tetratricopeptide repeat protein [Candidatus Dependentiae bacterium]|nr:tetratricopeptide repeat protein [Candidatus Dependentiae bacterium]